MNQSNGNEQYFTPEDIEQNKVVSALAYFIFFIPLLAAQGSPFGKFHANQGLVLLIASVVVYTVGSIIPIIGWFVILPLGSLASFILAILGLVNTLNGKANRLPFIGNIDLIK